MSLSNPSPKSLSYGNNLGSLLGMVMVFQVLSGLFLTLMFTNSAQEAYGSIASGEVNMAGGWFFHLFHSKLASLVFLLMYLHLFKHLLFGSQRLFQPWMVGVIILFLSMAIAFLGYSLTYSDMSFWAATVISNLFGVIPFVGAYLVVWFRGDFLVGGTTLKFFFMLHFLLPFLIFVLIFLHLEGLHQTGSTSKSGKNNNSFFVSFFPFVLKDLLNFFFLLLFSFLVLLFPYFMTDASAFVTANTLKSPAHIQPEWYFLLTYAVLRSSSHKSLAVLYLVFVLVIWLFFVPTYTSSSFSKSKIILIFGGAYFLLAINLSFLGSCTMESGYATATKVASISLGLLSIFFSFFIWL